jgi:O-Antigen ligase
MREPRGTVTAASVLLGGVVVGMASVLAPKAVATAVGLVVVMIAAPGLLLFFAVILFHGLGNAEAVRVGSVTATDVLLGLWLIRQLARAAMDRHRLQVARSSRWLAAFLAWAWLVTLLHGVRVTPLMRVTLYVAVSILLTNAGEIDRRAIRTAIVIYAAIEIVLTAPHIFRTRLVGETIGDSAQFGLLLLACLAVLVGCARPSTFRRWSVAIVLIWTIATVTRGIWFSLGVMLTLVLAKRLSFRRLVAVVAGGAVLGFLAIGPLTARLDLNASSGGVRLDSIRYGIAAAKDSPVTGHGWASQSTQTTLARPQEPAARPAFNLFVNVAAALGLPGVALLVTYLIQLFRELARGPRDAFLFGAAFFALSLTEMTIYAGSLGTVLFFLYAGLGSGRTATEDATVSSAWTSNPVGTRPRRLALVRLSTPSASLRSASVELRRSSRLRNQRL